MENKDRWSSLSISEKDALIKLYVSNGITSLDVIKKDYNSFDGGSNLHDKESNITQNTDDNTPTVLEDSAEGDNSSTRDKVQTPRVDASIKRATKIIGNSIKLALGEYLSSLKQQSLQESKVNKFGPGGPVNNTKWKALDNVDFKAIPDSTYTREKTGIGSIEFFHKDNPDGITYPNGYFREHPSPGENVILYDPKTNDEQDIRLDALHVMPQDPVYADLLAMYRLAANDGDVAHQADRDYKYYVDTYGMDKALKTFDAKDPQQLWERLFDNAADGLLRNMLIEGTPEYIESKRYYPNKQQLREWNSHLVPYIDEIQKYLETGERPWYMLEPAVVTAEVKSDGGNINTFATGGDKDSVEGEIWKREFKDLPQGFKQAILQLVEELNYNVEDAEELFNSGALRAPLDAKFRNTQSGRVRQNDSPTSDRSTALEDRMNTFIYNRSDAVRPNMQYAIPYIEDLEIKVPGVGRTTTNALDSLAKYAYEAQIPLEEALGLAAQETALGAIPLINYKDIPKNATEEEKQEVKEHNRALGNSSYFRNYGIIPAESMVRDFRYNIVEDPVSRDVPPLLHAFEYWKEGNYNRGDPSHNEDVKRKGREIMSTKVIQDWVKDSEFAQKVINLFK